MSSKAGEAGGVGLERAQTSFHLLDGFRDGWAHFYLDETPPVLMLRCADSERQRLAKESSSITVSDRMHWETEGWTWTDIPLDGTISEEALLSLIDQSYQLVYDSDAVKEDKKHQIDLIVHQLPQTHLLQFGGWFGGGGAQIPSFLRF